MVNPFVTTTIGEFLLEGNNPMGWPEYIDSVCLDVISEKVREF